MAVFVAASDETNGNDTHGVFRYSGFVAPEPDWYNIFAPLWERRVLSGPPKIPYLHMTEIRSKQWREKHNIDRGEGEFRVDEAFGVIKSIPSLVPVSCWLNAPHLAEVFEKEVHFTARNADRKFEPDYLGFIAYALTVLEYVARKHPEAEKVDFIVDRKTGITEYMQEFFYSLEDSYEYIDKSHIIPLIGQFIPGDKETRVPLQAADLLCWYSRRSAENTLDEREAKRYSIIAKRNGYNFQWPDEDIDLLYASILKELNEEKS